MTDKTKAERDALRDQLAAARNEALEEAKAECEAQRVKCNDNGQFEAAAFCKNLLVYIDALKSTTNAARGITLPEDLQVSPSTNPLPDACIHMTSDMSENCPRCNPGGVLGIKVCEKCGNGHWSDKPCPTCTPAPREVTVQEAARKAMTLMLEGIRKAALDTELGHSIIDDIFYPAIDGYITKAIEQEGHSDG